VSFVALLVFVVQQNSFKSNPCFICSSTVKLLQIKPLLYM